MRALPQPLAAVLVSALCAHGVLKEILAFHLLLMTRYMVKAYLNLVIAILFSLQTKLNDTLILRNLACELTYEIASAIPPLQRLLPNLRIFARKLY